MHICWSYVNRRQEDYIGMLVVWVFRKWYSVVFPKSKHWGMFYHQPIQSWIYESVDFPVKSKNVSKYRLFGILFQTEHYFLQFTFMLKQLKSRCKVLSLSFILEVFLNWEWMGVSLCTQETLWGRLSCW